MKRLSSLLLLSSLGFGTSSLFASEEWHCYHKDKKIKVTGKDPKAKQSACESKGGIWSKEHHDKHHEKHHEGQSSGGGGSW